MPANMQYNGGAGVLPHRLQWRSSMKYWLAALAVAFGPPAFAQEGDVIHVSSPLLPDRLVGSAASEGIVSLGGECRLACNLSAEDLFSSSPPWYFSTDNRIEVEIQDQWRIVGESGPVSGLLRSEADRSFGVRKDGSLKNPIVVGKYVKLGLAFSVSDSQSYGAFVRLDKFNLDAADTEDFEAFEFGLETRLRF